MGQSLQKLIRLIPPLPGQKHTNVDWPTVEAHLGITYPDSFKDFVAIYGSSHWFDKILPFYCPFSDARRLDEFKGWVTEKLKAIGDDMRDEQYRPVQVPCYPTPGGLFPFMADIDGPDYFWLTNSPDPNRWPIYCWTESRFVVLTEATICSMLVGFLERDSKMIELWGDVNDFEPDRIKIEDVSAETW